MCVYVSNESQGWDVFFDNLTVQHRTGPITEETHYYPFGLTMAGINDKSAGGLENKNKYNGIELDTSLGLDQYEAQLRDLDPQTGRWWQIDPETEDQEMWSPYTSNYDNPILYQDPKGNTGETCCGGLLDALSDAVDKIMVSAGGVLFGSLHTVSGGLIPSDPFHESNLPNGAGMYFKNGNMVGKLAPYAPGPAGAVEGNAESPAVESPSLPKTEPAKPNTPETPVSNTKQSTSSSSSGKYSNLKEPKKVGDGLKTTSAQRARILKANRAANGGVIKSDISGETLDQPVLTKKGEKANMNQAEVDHVKQRSKGGSNSNSNLQVTSKKENLDKRE